MRFLKKHREEKLYKQWVEHDGLPPEAIPKQETAEGWQIGTEERDRLRPYKEKILAMVRKLLRM